MTAMIHHTITVTTYTNELAMVAHSEASKIFPDVSPIAVSQFNGYRSFFIPPDGSKWGWPEDLEADARRFQFIGWLDGQADEDGGNAYEWFEARYGREAEYDGEVRAEVVNGSHTTERIGADGRTPERERIIEFMSERTVCEKCGGIRWFQKKGRRCPWCTVTELQAQLVRVGVTEYEFLGADEEGGNMRDRIKRQTVRMGGKVIEVQPNSVLYDEGRPPAKVGDEISFTLSGHKITARVTNVERAGGKPYDICHVSPCGSPNCDICHPPATTKEST